MVESLEEMYSCSKVQWNTCHLMSVYIIIIIIIAHGTENF